MHARPQLHRFSLTRFAARIREISDNVAYTCRSSRFSLPRHPLTSVIYDCAARYGVHPARSSSVIPPRLPSFHLSFFCRIRDCTHWVGSLFCSGIHVYPREETCDERKCVVATRANFVPRASFVSTSFHGFSMAEESVVNILHAINIIVWNVFSFPTLLQLLL